MISDLLKEPFGFVMNTLTIPDGSGQLMNEKTFTAKDAKFRKVTPAHPEPSIIVAHFAYFAVRNPMPERALMYGLTGLIIV